jgi:phospholipid/cholesterol/gamma-HCH transport system ATP-binding protein
VIDARNLNVTAFGRIVFANLNLQVGQGEVVGIIGPPESGKSTLLKTLALLQPLCAGTLQLQEVEVTPATGPAQISALQRRIGLSFQNNALFDAWSVFDNVAFPLRHRGMSEAQLRPQVTARLHDVELWEARDLLPKALSGGMQKRLGVARATIAEPRLGLFDEPIAGLDPQTAGKILALLVRLTHSLGMASLIVSNDLAALLPFCPRVIMLVEGVIVFDGEPQHLIESRRPEVVQFATGGHEGPL